MNKALMRWTPEEDEKVVTLRNQGKDWDVMAEELPGRSAAAIKARFFGLKTGRVRPRRDHGKPWSEEEIKRLIEMYEEKEMAWSAIDKALGRPAGAAYAKYNTTNKRLVQASSYDSRAVTRRQINEAEAAREARAHLTHDSITAFVFGDPLPGRSALDQKRAGAQ